MSKVAPTLCFSENEECDVVQQAILDKLMDLEQAFGLSSPILTQVGGVKLVWQKRMAAKKLFSGIRLSFTLLVTKTTCLYSLD